MKKLRGALCVRDARGRPVWVFLAHVALIEPAAGGVIVRTGGGDCVEVGGDDAALLVEVAALVKDETLAALDARAGGAA